MAFGTKAKFETLRELAFGSIGAAYTPVGDMTEDFTRQVSIYNSTDVDLYFSTDKDTNMVRVAAGTGQVHDVTANKVTDDGLFFRKGTQFYVKQTAAGAPSSGNVWIQVIAADGGT